MPIIKISHIKGPLSWNIIKSFHCNAPDYALPRTLETVNKYKKHIDNLKKINKTVGEYLNEKLFKNNESYKIEANLFPYHLQNNNEYYIEHYIIWFNDKLNIKDIITKPLLVIDKIIQEFINKKAISNPFENDPLNNIEYIYFENSLKNKSVPEIRHLHLFIKILKNPPLNKLNKLKQLKYSKLKYFLI